MRKKVVIIRIPNSLSRAWRFLLGAGLLAVGTVVYAFAPFNLTDPAAGTPVSASLFKANNQALRDKVTELEAAVSKPVYTNATTGRAWSLNASYCGSTTPTTGKVIDGSLAGNVATKSLCEKTCANSPTAHMCITSEVQRYLATGGSFPNPESWYSAGVWSSDVLGSSGLGSRIITDCNGWTDNTAPVAGMPGTGVEGPASYPTDSAHGAYCSESHPILCCD